MGPTLAAQALLGLSVRRSRHPWRDFRLVPLPALNSGQGLNRCRRPGFPRWFPEQVVPLPARRAAIHAPAAAIPARRLHFPGRQSAVLGSAGSPDGYFPESGLSNWQIHRPPVPDCWYCGRYPASSFSGSVHRQHLPPVERVCGCASATPEPDFRLQQACPVEGFLQSVGCQEQALRRLKVYLPRVCPVDERPAAVRKPKRPALPTGEVYFRRLQF